MLSIDNIRSHFPAIQTAPDVFLDNAGGSQIPECVANGMRDYMLSTYAQLGADYETSRRSTEVVDQAHDFINLFVNGVATGKVLLASSTSVLCAMLADCVARAPKSGRDEIVVAETAHEANAGPWHRLADRGFHVKNWPYDAEQSALTIEGLKSVLSSRTRIVAFPHVSNVLGGIEDARSLINIAHEAGARVVIDGVAYAPHRAMDVADLDVDWYVYSTYKVFGPHMAALYGKRSAFEELEGPNHFFIPNHDIPYKFEVGGPSHEGCAGLLALWRYFAAVAQKEATDPHDRNTITDVYDHWTGLETQLQQQFLDYLRSKNQLRVIGPSHADTSRVCTVSFAHDTKRSEEIAKYANERGFGIRYGHFYAYRICDRLAKEGILHDVEDGVVRVSMLHYNTQDEISRLCQCLDEIL